MTTIDITDALLNDLEAQARAELTTGNDVHVVALDAYVALALVARIRALEHDRAFEHDRYLAARRQVIALGGMRP